MAVKLVSGFRSEDRVQSSRFLVCGLGFVVPGSEFRVQGCGFQEILHSKP